MAGHRHHRASSPLDLPPAQRAERSGRRGASLRLRVALAAVVAVALVLGIVGVALVAFVARDQRRALDACLVRQAAALDRPRLLTPEVTGRLDTAGTLGFGSFVRVVDADGAVRLEAGDLPATSLPVPPIDGVGRETIDIGGEAYRVVADGGPAETDELAESFNQILARLERSSWWSGGRRDCGSLSTTSSTTPPAMVDQSTARPGVDRPSWPSMRNGGQGPPFGPPRAKRP